MVEKPVTVLQVFFNTGWRFTCMGATPTFSSSSATQTNINWQCSDDNGQTMSYWINSQRFKPGSPTYVGQVYSGTGALGHHNLRQ
ncbi:hypothetical protein CM15mP35_05200 [bacterium]|nr:MAG: hypothetical protein CM15mP35_05200 [bacterium]